MKFPRPNAGCDIRPRLTDCEQLGKCHDKEWRQIEEGHWQEFDLGIAEYDSRLICEGQNAAEYERDHGCPENDWSGQKPQETCVVGTTNLH